MICVNIKYYDLIIIFKEVLYELPELKIGELVAKVPIVQGGMGVGISLSSLAGAVALNGGVGVISGVEIGFNEPDYFKTKHRLISEL